MTKNPPGSFTTTAGAGGGGDVTGRRGSGVLGGGTAIAVRGFAPRSDEYDEARFLTLCEIVRQLSNGGLREVSTSRKESVLADVRPKYRFKLSSADAALDSFAYLLTCSSDAHCAAVSPTWLTQHLVKLAIAWDFRDSPAKDRGVLGGDAESPPGAYRDICTAAESIVRTIAKYHRSTNATERTWLESRLVNFSFSKIYSRWTRCSAFLERVITHPVFYNDDTAFEKTRMRAPSINNQHRHHPHNSNHHSHPNHHHHIRDDEDETEIALRIKILEDSTGKELGYQGYFLYVLRSLQALFTKIAAARNSDQPTDEKAAEETAIALDALWHLTERSPRFRHFISIQPAGDSKSPEIEDDIEGYDPIDESGLNQAARNPNFRRLTKLSAVSGAISCLLGCKFLRKVSKSCNFELEFITENGAPTSSPSLSPKKARSPLTPPSSPPLPLRPGTGSSSSNSNSTDNNHSDYEHFGSFETTESICRYLLPWMHRDPSQLDEALSALNFLDFNPVPRDVGVHAEMLIACHLQKLNIAKARPFYIGTSRYPCLTCEIFISRIPGVMVHRGKGETRPCRLPFVQDKNGYCNAAREFVYSRMTAIAADELNSAMNSMKLIETPSSEDDDRDIGFELFS